MTPDDGPARDAWEIWYPALEVAWRLRSGAYYGGSKENALRALRRRRPHVDRQVVDDAFARSLVVADALWRERAVLRARLPRDVGRARSAPKWVYAVLGANGHGITPGAVDEILAVALAARPLRVRSPGPSGW